MGSKKRNRVIKSLAQAANLPLVMTNTTERHFVDGAELIEQGQYEVGGQKVQAGLLYPQRMPVQIAFNHGRRLKRAFKKNGVAGIQDYLKKINSIAEKNISENKSDHGN